MKDIFFLIEKIIVFILGCVLNGSRCVLDSEVLK